MWKRKWLRWIVVLAIALFVASIGISRALQTTAARRYLLAHLESSFGRPVEVGRFNFSLFDGARLEAQSVTISEDPHFGAEYFLRADTLTAGLRWSALFSGRFEFGTLYLSRPSLNLVRDTGGRWNIEDWLPPASTGNSRPEFVGSSTASRRNSTARLYRIEVDAGRINFKQGSDKSPFALLDVSGRMDHDGAGRWQLDLAARPMRAGVELQEIGSFRLRGSIAGTSARLQPAELSLSWQNISVADALRLSRQTDYGVRGQLNLDLNARVAPPNPASNDDTQRGGARWSISGVARLNGVHGWRLSEHDTDPAANISVEAAWRLGESRAQIGKFLIETPNTHVGGAGSLDWTHGFNPNLHIQSSTLGLRDVLAWYRAFRPNVAEDLVFEGTLGIDATFGGWPLQLEQGALASAGASFTLPSLQSPMRIGAINASVARGGLEFAPTEISFTKAVSESAADTVSANDTSPNSFTVRGMILPDRTRILRWPPNWNFSIEGGTPGIEDWLALSQALAQPLTHGWTAQGGVAARMVGVHLAESSAASWVGSMDFHGLTATPAFVNLPLHFPASHIEFQPLQRAVTLFGAEAFGATWRGTVVRKNLDGKWTFDLSADHLDAVDFDRWLGPRARPSLLARFANLGKSVVDVSERDAAVDSISARGRLRATRITLAPLHVEKFDGDVELSGRAITIHKAQADFFGGKVAGSFDARLLADPSYHFQGQFDRVDLAKLAQAVPSLNDRISGTASASLVVVTNGVGHENLIRSMEGDGKLDARTAELRGLDFSGLIATGSAGPESGQFSSVQGSFHIGNGGINLTDFVLDNSRGRFQMEGRIDFSHALDLRIHPSIFHATTTLASAPPPSFLVGGTVETPTLSLPGVPSKAPARSGIRGR